MSSTESPNPNPDEVTLVAPDGHSETINFTDMPVLNDPNCQHDFVREPEPDIPGTYTEVCRKCPVGRIVRA